MKIDQIDLDDAKAMGNKDLLETIFGEARKVIADGGTVTIEEQYVNAPTGKVAEINNESDLDEFMKKYLSD